MNEEKNDIEKNEGEDRLAVDRRSLGRRVFVVSVVLSLVAGAMLVWEIIEHLVIH